jgi:choline kinase
MDNTTVVILAAGRGTRLRGAFGGMPKGFLPFRQTTFIERALDMLAAAKADRTIIVTGYQGNHYADLAARRGGQVETVFNPAFADMGTAQSLLVGLERCKGSVVVMDADIVYDAQAIMRILDPAVHSGIVLSDIANSSDNIFAWTVDSSNGRGLVHLSKNLSTMPSSPSGEHIGIIKLSAELAREMRDTSPQLIAREPMIAYEQCLTPLLAKHHVSAVDIPDLVWTEVDDMEMWERAKVSVFPRLSP